MLMSMQPEMGARCEAVVLAAGKDRMRLAAVGEHDTIELTMVAGQWFDEGGRRIAIDAMVALDGMEYSHICPRAIAAGAFWD